MRFTSFLFVFLLAITLTFTITATPVVMDGIGDQQTIIEKYDVKDCPDHVLLVVSVVDKNGIVVKYSFLITDQEANDAIEQAVMEYKETLDFVLTMRANNEREKA